MRTFRRILYTSCVYVIAMTGCASNPPVPPKIVNVPLNVYVPIPAELTAPCVAPALTDRTWGGLADYAVVLRGALQQCSDRMAAIRGIQGTPAQPEKP